MSFYYLPNRNNEHLAIINNNSWSLQEFGTILANYRIQIQEYSHTQSVPTIYAHELTQKIFYEQRDPKSLQYLHGILGLFILEKIFNYKLEIRDFYLNNIKSTNHDFWSIIKSQSSLIQSAKWGMIYIDDNLIGSLSVNCGVFIAKNNCLSEIKSVPWIENGELNDPLQYFNDHHTHEKREIVVNLLNQWIEQNNDIWNGTINPLPDRLESVILSNYFQLPYRDVIRSESHLLYDKYISKWRGLMSLYCFKDLYNITVENNRLIQKNSILAEWDDNFGWIPNENLTIECEFFINDSFIDPTNNINISEAKKLFIHKWISKNIQNLNPGTKLFDLLNRWKEDLNFVSYKKEYNYCSISLNNENQIIKSAVLSGFCVNPESIFLNSLYFISSNNNNSISLEVSEGLNCLLPLSGNYDYDLSNFAVFSEKTENDKYLKVSVITNKTFIEKIFLNHYIDLDQQNTFNPFIEVWPNFSHQDWDQYYLYFDAATEFPEDLRIETENKVIERGIIVESDKNFKKLKFYKSNMEAGILLLKTRKLESRGAERTWDVSIDFGSSNTGIFYNDDDYFELLPIEDRNCQINQTNIETVRKYQLWNNFFTPDMISKPFLSAFMSKTEKTTHLKAVVDGVIYFRDGRLDWENVNQKSLKTSLKWDDRNRRYIELFLKQILLMIKCEAFVKNAVISNILWSYPGAFSPRILLTYRNSWRNIVQEIIPEANVKYLEESNANYFYFKSLLDDVLHLRYSIIVDIGGSTTDIAIFQNSKGNTARTMSSVKFAAESLIKIAFKSQEFRDLIITSENIQTAGIKEFFALKADLVMNSYLKTLNNLDQNPFTRQIDNEIVIKTKSIILLNFISLIYYTAMAAKVLNIQDQHWNIYFSGNGSRLREWIGSQELQKELITRVFNSIFNDRSSFDIPQLDGYKIKYEVGIGLLKGDHNMHVKKEDILLLGETINDELTTYNNIFTIFDNEDNAPNNENLEIKNNINDNYGKFVMDSFEQ